MSLCTITTQAGMLDASERKPRVGNHRSAHEDAGCGGHMGPRPVPRLSARLRIQYRGALVR